MLTSKQNAHAWFACERPTVIPHTNKNRCKRGKTLCLIEYLCALPVSTGENIGVQRDWIRHMITVWQQQFLLRPLGRSVLSLLCVCSAVCSFSCTYKPWWLQALDQIHVQALEGWQNENSMVVIVFVILLFTVIKNNITSKLLIARDMMIIVITTSLEWMEGCYPTTWLAVKYFFVS